MKNNVKIVLLAIIIIFLSIILIKIYGTDINPIIKNNTIIKQNKMLTMMFESTTETGVYEANDEETSFDQEDYYFNSNLSGCEHGGTVSFDGGTVTMQSSYTDKCFVYFSTSAPLTITTVDDIISTVNNNCTVTVNGTEGTISDIASTNEGLCAIGDGMYGGTTYYYRGAVNNNWVYFAGIYWRIIRINGDGSIRLIYSGINPPIDDTPTGGLNNNSRGAVGSSVALPVNIAFNPGYDDNKYFGYYYTDGEVHGRDVASTMARNLEVWYKKLFDPTYGTKKDYSNYIDLNGKFCNDRTVSSGTGLGDDYTIYAGKIRYENKTASTECTNNDDIFFKIGLITLDEVMLAGGYRGNELYYLWSTAGFYTMTPYYYHSTYKRVFIFITNSSGTITNDNAPAEREVRPVINLKSGTTFKAGTDGTWQHPYEVVED